MTRYLLILSGSITKFSVRVTIVQFIFITGVNSLLDHFDWCKLVFFIFLCYNWIIQYFFIDITYKQKSACSTLMLKNVFDFRSDFFFQIRKLWQNSNVYFLRCILPYVYFNATLIASFEIGIPYGYFVNIWWNWSFVKCSHFTTRSHLLWILGC